MDRESFDRLNVKKQIEYINNRLLEGESLRKITDDLSIARRTIRVRFKKNNYIFDKDKKIYINITQDKENIEDKDYKSNINVVEERDKKDYKSNTNVILDKVEEKEEKKTEQKQDKKDKELLKLLEQREEIYEMLEWFKTIKNKKNEENEIQDIKINKDKVQGEISVTTIRIYKDIKEEFKKVIKEHPEFKSQDLYSQALLEFIEKYKK